MFKTPDYNLTVSLRLSKVLSDIGVNDRVVRKRRQTHLVKEALHTISHKCSGANITIYNFGSQSEGATTSDMTSDLVCLKCLNDINIMQDLRQWKLGFANLLMIQDESTPPGYCLLQGFCSDVPLPLSHIPNRLFMRDTKGRILCYEFGCVTCNNALMQEHAEITGIRHGPAFTTSSNGGRDHDLSPAYRCKSWPLEATPWLRRSSTGRWPSQEIKTLSANSGCFVVRVGQTGSENESFQWRISTSLAERHLMFSLNITQIRCYILMKMIIKTYFNPQFENKLSSFMCKNVLLHCIENTHSKIWQENNLLSCLTVCLFFLYNCISVAYCPHFIIHENNLMTGKLSDEVKPQLLTIINDLIRTKGAALLGIDIDDLGKRLSGDLVVIDPFSYWRSPCISGVLLSECAEELICFLNEGILKRLRYVCNHTAAQFLFKTLVKLTHEPFHEEMHNYEQTAVMLMLPFVFTYLGSILASYSISVNNTISLPALVCFSTGLTSDVSSSRLKLASVFYCIGDFDRAEIVLQDIEKRYVINAVEPIGKCHCRRWKRWTHETFCYMSYTQEGVSLENVTAFRVHYMPTEMYCIPRELQYELFSHAYESIFLGHTEPKPMNETGIDSLPYLYFLQYKTYGHLNRHGKQQSALSNFVRTIDSNLHIQIPRRFTALNLLGQCMEQENRLIDALRYFQLSLNSYKENGTTKVHICRVLSKLRNSL